VNASSTGAALPHSYVSELNSNLFGFIDAYEGPLLGAFQRFIASSLKVAFGRLHQFAAPSANGRYLRTPAIQSGIKRLSFTTGPPSFSRAIYCENQNPCYAPKLPDRRRLGRRGEAGGGVRKHLNRRQRVEKPGSRKAKESDFVFVGFCRLSAI
jgi:hypothetical protein